MYRNYALTVAKTGGETILVRDDGTPYFLMAVLKSDVGCLDATGLIATGSVRKSTSGGYTVADYVRRDAA